MGLVFCTQEGRALALRDVLRILYRLRDRGTLAKHGFHSLRHTKATLDKAAGADISEVAASLGHASAAFTAKTYTHVLPATRRAAAVRFAAFVQAGGEAE